MGFAPSISAAQLLDNGRDQRLCFLRKLSCGITFYCGCLSAAQGLIVERDRGDHLIVKIPRIGIGACQTGNRGLQRRRAARIKPSAKQIVFGRTRLIAARKFL